MSQNDKDNDSEDGRPLAIVTGGGTGVGAATALMLAARGYDVVVNYSRSSAAAEAVAGRCRDAGVAIQADVADDAACRGIADFAADRRGRIDTLVNSAGTTRFVGITDLEAQKVEDFQEVFAVNTLGPFQMARAAAPYLRRSPVASVVNVSSIAGQVGNGSSMAYIASKGALNSLTLALARSLAPDVRVNAVAPGMISGRWFREGAGEEAYDRARTAFAANAALGTVSTPEDVAQAVVFLVDGCSTVTGQILPVDAGVLLGPAPNLASDADKDDD